MGRMTFLPCQIFPEETPMQEQEPDSPLNDPISIEGDPIAIDTQTINSLVRHITYGKEVLCPFHSSAIIMN